VRHLAFVAMSNVLSEAKRQQVIALGRLGWPLRRIEQETPKRIQGNATPLNSVFLPIPLYETDVLGPE